MFSTTTVFFAHGENILVLMLSNSDEFVRRKAVNIIMKLRENGEQVSEGELTEDVNNNVDVSDEMIESFLNMSQYPPMDKSVRVFKKPIINFKASSYHEMTPSEWRTQPPVLKEYNNSFIRSLEQIPLKLDFKCHSQNIERHVKTVTEAAAAVCGHDRSDGNIRNKIKSRKLMKSFISKKCFNASSFE